MAFTYMGNTPVMITKCQVQSLIVTPLFYSANVLNVWKYVVISGYVSETVAVVCLELFIRILNHKIWNNYKYLIVIVNCHLCNTGLVSSC